MTNNSHESREVGQGELLDALKLLYDARHRPGLSKQERKELKWEELRLQMRLDSEHWERWRSYRYLAKSPGAQWAALLIRGGLLIAVVLLATSRPGWQFVLSFVRLVRRLTLVFR